MSATAPTTRLAIAIVGTVMMIGVLAVAAGAAMTSTRLGPGLCETSGGGKFVDLPQFPGEMLDRRLLADLHLLEKRYSIFVTDGYSMSDEHATNGEHPLGLALDIVPNKAKGGRWSDVTRLARWAEPRQNRPRAPFRWVGYNGDEGHGRGDHLHLSWSHSPARPGRPARTVYTVRCPAATGPPPVVEPQPAPEEDPAGGASPGDGGGSGSGGIGDHARLAPPVIETDGVSAGR